MGNATPMRGTKSRVSEAAAAQTTPAAPAPSAARELDTAWRRVRALEQGVRALEKEVILLKTIRREQAAEIAALKSSTFWRMTAPLRGLVMLLRGQGSLIGPAADRLARPRPAKPPPPPSAPAPTLRMRPAAESLPVLAPLSFPLPQRLAWSPELTGEDVVPLPATVSVVIPTYNAGPEFHWLLRKLTAQKGLAGIEVVVVDSGSSDGTAELAQSMGCTLVRIPQSEFSHSHARNLGADAAGGELLLFTVQDAYPVGDYWLYSLARALTQPRSEVERVAALSCSEFPRRDSELIYNAGIDTHYRFLGCRDADRVGALTAEDHTSLRTQGQLSDVACLIPAATFQDYRYQGDYAEDLILGVRMIRDGHRIALLSSVQVIHSHNRPAAYHLKRTFVDVLFLTDAFADFSLPFVETVSGAIAAAAALQKDLDAWRPVVGQPPADQLRRLAEQARRLPLHQLSVPATLDFGLPALGPWVAGAVAAEGWVARIDAEAFAHMFADKLDALADFAGGVYGETDAHLADQLAQAAAKSLAACVGAQLCFFYLSHAYAAEGAAAARLQALRDLMLAGV